MTASSVDQISENRSYETICLIFSPCTVAISHMKSYVWCMGAIMRREITVDWKDTGNRERRLICVVSKCRHLLYATQLLRTSTGRYGATVFYLKDRYLRETRVNIDIEPVRCNDFIIDTCGNVKFNWAACPRNSSYIPHKYSIPDRHIEWLKFQNYTIIKFGGY